MCDKGQDSASQLYDRLWAGALEAFNAGQVALDPHLLNRAADDRRGLSVIARPDPALGGAMADLIARIERCAPGQHVYRPDEWHVTVLALFTVRAGFDLDDIPLAAYDALLADVCAHAEPFRLTYRGITATPESVMICGCVDGDALNTLRDRLRAAIRQAGLPNTVDRRFRITAAHSTVLRFRSVPDDLPGMVRGLSALRDHAVGTFEIGAIELVETDWFMSHDKVRVAGRYALGQE